MAAIITGNDLGLYTNPLTPRGDGLLGRSGQSDSVFINSATGNLVIARQDDHLASSGLDLALIRTYNAQGQLTDDNGDNWRLGVQQQLHGLTGIVNTAGSTITKVFGDGAEISYAYDETLGLYVSTAGAGAHDTLAYDATLEGWTWREGTTRVAETYDSAGQLIATRDSLGNTITYSYTGTLLTQITDASGQITHLDYTGSNLTQIRTVSGTQTETKVRYSYDALNRLSRVIVDLSPEDNTIADGHTYTTTYTYEGESQRIASITQGDGTTVGFTYELVNGQHRIKTYTDGAGRVTTLTYTQTVDGMQTDLTTPLGHVTSYFTDSEGRLTRVLGPSIDGLRPETRYVYDGEGNVIDVIDARGHATVREYDAWGNVLRSRDSAGNTIERTYSSTHQLVTETVYRIPDPDGAGVGQPSEPSTTRYVYDAQDNLRFSVSAEGRVSEHRYDAAGNRKATLTYTGGVYDLSALGPRDSVTEAQLQSWMTTQDLSRLQRIDYAYDFRGNLDTRTTYRETGIDGLGVPSTATITRYVYDQRGRLLETIDPRGEATPQAGDYVTSYTYDGLGRLLTTTQWVSEGQTRTSINHYDDANNQTRTMLVNGLSTTAVYNGAGELVSLTEADTSQALGTTSYHYDAAGRLRITTDPTGVKTHYLYDEAGRRVAVIDGTGAMTETVYDATGNVTRTIRYANDLSATQRASLTDIEGNPAEVALSTLRPAADASRDRVTRFIYDPADRLVLTIEPDDTITTQGYVTQRFYDGAGRLTDVIRYARPIDLVGLSADPTPGDITARITSATNDRHSRSFYDKDGKLVATLDPVGYLCEYHYDAGGRLTETRHYAKAVAVHDASGALDAAATETLRASGNFATLRQNVLDQGASPDDQHAYNFYDAKGQLIAVLDAEGYLTEYAYDHAGNRTEETRYYTKANPYTGSETLTQLRPLAHANDQVVISAYDGANQLTERTTHPQATVTHYTYDSAGTLIQTDKAWNTSEVRTLRARYDAKGNILQELSGEGSAALESLLALNPAATEAEIEQIWAQWSRTHTYDAASRRTSTTDPNGHKTLFYYDPNGRLTHTVNALGEVTETTYNAFGQAEDTIRYTGRIDTTGLTGGLITETLTTRLAAIADAVQDSRTRVNYTLRGAVKEAIEAYGTALSSATRYTYDAFGAKDTEATELTATTSRLDRFIYDRRGLLIQTAEDHGGLNRLTARTYDAFGRITSTTDALDVTRTYAYDKRGREVAATDPAGTRTTIYDAFDRRFETTDARGHTTTYRYDDANRSFTLTTPEGVRTITQKNRHGETVALELQEATGESKRLTTYRYDKNGNLIEETEGGSLNLSTRYTYDRANRKILTQDANGAYTRFDYDAANRLLSRIVDPASIHSLDDNPAGLNLTTTYRYDGQGRTVAVTEGAGTSEARVTKTTYDAKGQVIETRVDPSGLNLRTTYTYDQSGRTLTVTEGAGTADVRTDTYAYDGIGRLTLHVKDAGGLNIRCVYVYDLNDNLIKKTEADGTGEARITRYVYDANNRVAYVIDNAGGVTHRVYDANGNMVQTIAYATVLTATQLHGLPAVPTVADISALITVKSNKDHVTRFAYDTDNRLVYQVDAFGGVTQNLYDANNSVIKRVAYAQALSAANLASIDAAPENGRSLIDSVVTAAGFADAAQDRVDYFAYDSANRLVYAVDGLGHVTESIYDASGNRLRQIAYANPVATSLADNNPTARTDIQNALLMSADATNDRSIRTVYDAANRVVFRIDAAGYVTETEYDGVSRVKSTTAYAAAVNLGANPTEADVRAAVAVISNAAADQSTKFKYDGAGRLIRTTDTQGFMEHYDYDARGNKISFTNKNGIDRGDPAHTWIYRYDAADRLIEEITPVTRVTRLGQDAAGNLVPTVLQGKVVTRMTYDGLGNVQTRTEGILRTGTDAVVDDAAQARTTTYVYDALGRQIQTIFPKTSLYDEASDIAVNYVGRNDVLLTPTSTTYFDTFGNAVANRDVNGNFTYKIYDLLGRVRYEIDAERYVIAYQYDAFGNRNALVRYAHPLAESHFAAREVNATAIDIDAIGMATIEGLLPEISGGASRTLTMIHDRENRLVETKEPQVFAFDSSALAGQQSFVASPTTRNIYNAFGQAVKQSILKNPITNTWIDTYLYYNQRGEKVAQVDAAGHLTTYAYDASGNLIEQTEYAKALTPGSWSVQGYGTPTPTVPTVAASTSAIGFDRTTRFVYDNLNRKTQDIQVNVQYAGATYDGAATITDQLGDLGTRYSYDRLGNLVSVTAPTGATAYTYYDVLGRIVATAQPTRTTDILTGGGSAQTPFVRGVNVNSLAWGRAALTGVSGTTAFLDGAQGTLSVDEDGATFTVAGKTLNVQVVSNEDGTTKYYVSHWVGGQNKVALSWDDLSPWGAGDVRVTLTYDAKNGSGQTSAGHTTSAIFTGASTNTGVTVAWNAVGIDVNRAAYHGVSKVTAIAVEKNVGGVWLALHELNQSNMVSVPPATNATKSLTPLTTFGRDIYGNAVTQVNHANGVIITADGGYALLGADAVNDQITYAVYDAMGRTVENRDPKGNRKFFSYDALGHVRKQWSTLTDVDGKARQVTTTYGYDRAGRQTHTNEIQMGIDWAANGFPTVNNQSVWKISQLTGVSGTTAFLDGVQGTLSVDEDGGTFTISGQKLNVRVVSNEDGTTSYRVGHWSGGQNSVTVNWGVLPDLGGGDIRVTLVYVAENGAGATLANQSRSQIVTAGTTSATFTWGYSGYDGNQASYHRLKAVVGVSLQKFVNGQWVTAATSVDRFDSRYNAFGEITTKGLNGGGQEYFDYDETGRLWRTNQERGADTVYLYDLQGNATAAIKSADVDLKAALYATAADVAGESNVIRTETRYDALGRAVQQTQAMFSEDVSLPTINMPLQVKYTFVNQTGMKQLAWGEAKLQKIGTGYYLNGVQGTLRVDEDGGTFTVAGKIFKVRVAVNEDGTVYYAQGVWAGGKNQVSLSWNDLTDWGNGNVRVTINYTAANAFGATQAQTQTRTVASGTGATIKWDTGIYNNASEFHRLVRVNSVRVEKQLANGSWVILNNGGMPFNGNIAHWKAPADVAGNQAVLRYWPSTNPNSVTTVTPARSGDLYWVNLSTLADGTYGYKLEYTLPGATSPYAKDFGTFTIVNSDTVSTVNPPAPVYRSATPVINQTHDRWGNVLSATDPRNVAWATTFRYDHNNQVIEKKAPEVTVANANGTSELKRPTTLVRFDALGRELAVTDPNGNVRAKQYNEAGQLVAEFNPDGGVVRYSYDALGRRTAIQDANRNLIRNSYDRNNRLVQEQTPLNSTRYTYDEAGNRITVTNGANETTRYFYDTRGNIIMTRFPLGGTNAATSHYTAATYDALGRKVSERNGNGDGQTWTYHYFGHLLEHTDLGGATFRYDYNPHTFWLKSQTSTRGQAQRFEYYENGWLKFIHDDALLRDTYYAYDAMGNRTREGFLGMSKGPVYQYERIGYDALGRVTMIDDINRYTLTYSYDANGNRRRTFAKYFDINGKQITEDNWYTYDKMDRILISQGRLINGTIQIDPSQGTRLFYDDAGNRTRADFYENQTLVTETYVYDAEGRITSTAKNGVQTSQRLYDGAGRVREYVTFNGAGAVSERRAYSYNLNGRVTAQTNTDTNGSVVSKVLYDSYDFVGNVLQYRLQVLQGTAYTNTYTYTYAKHDAYREQQIAGTSTFFLNGNTVYKYDFNGNLIQVVDQFNDTPTRDYIVNTQGVILQKRQSNKTQYYFYANGKPMGSAGELSGADFDYNYTPVSDHYPATTPSSYVFGNGDTLQSIALAVYGDAKLWYLIADANGVQSAAELTVGQTLVIPNVISNLHNDSNTFKPYDPGQIIGNTTPTLPDPPPPSDDKCGGFGMILVIVVAVVATVVTAGAAAAALPGTATATAGMGTWAAGTAALSGGLGATGIAAAAIGGAVGSIASQLVGIGVGVQDKFSWGAVAMGALGSAATAGLGTIGQGGIAEKVFRVTAKNSQYLNTAINGMAANVASQGIGIITGQQEKFDWKGVAFAGASAAANQYMAGTEFGKNLGLGADPQAARRFSWGDVARQTVGGIVKGAVVQAFSNGKVDWQRVGADAFGNALANSIVAAGKFSDAKNALRSQFEQWLANGAKARLVDGRIVATDGRALPVMFADAGKIGGMNDVGDSLHENGGNDEWETDGIDGNSRADSVSSLSESDSMSPTAAEALKASKFSWASVANFFKGAVDWIIGENYGAAWKALFADEWVTELPDGRRLPTQMALPESILEGMIEVHGRLPEDAAANGMHAWHAGSNAYLAQQFGIIGAPLLFLAGVYHESPLDWASFKAEQQWQGTVNHALDSGMDIIANVFGMATGYLIPGNTGVDFAIKSGNYIPGPGEPDPQFGGNGAYQGNPSDAWGQYPK